MVEQAVPEPYYLCRLCHHPTPLDDVQLLFAGRERCICLRCYLSVVGAGATPGTPVPAPDAAGAPPVGAGPPQMRWWCMACDDERWLPFVHFHRMPCPVCASPMRRWDEQWHPRG